MNPEKGYTIIEGAEIGLCKSCGAHLGDTIGCTECEYERNKVKYEEALKTSRENARQQANPDVAKLEKYRKTIIKMNDEFMKRKARGDKEKQ